jgi:hypothetical protein
MLMDLTGKPVRAFVVWEPVLPTDWGPPSTAALRRISDSRAVQFWDKARLVSHRMGERDKCSIVWDHIAVYAQGAAWNESPPEAVYADGPVVKVLEPTRSAIAKALGGP